MGKKVNNEDFYSDIVLVTTEMGYHSNEPKTEINVFKIKVHDQNKNIIFSL